MPAHSGKTGQSSLWFRRWLEGAGAAILLAPGLLWTQISHTRIDVYHRLLPLNTVVRALAVDLILLSVLAMLAIRALEWKSPGSESRRRFWSLVWALWFGLLATRAVAGLISSETLTWQQITPARAFLVAAGALALLWMISPRLFLQGVRGLRFGLLLLGFCIFWIVPTLLFAGLAHQPYDRVAFHKPVPSATSSHRRIVWLLFDEMSYDQTFAHRWPGLELPNLDRLRSESTTFSDVDPDGYFTEDVIPSLLIGQPIDGVEGSRDGWMLYRSGQSGSWQRYNPDRTLFATALQQGWTTGALGSFNPYCRIFADVLDSCWMDLPPLPDHFSRDKSTLANVLAPLQANWKRLWHRQHRSVVKWPDPLDQIPAVRAADALIGDTTIDFCFVHLPLPHPPGFYNRKTGRIGPGGSYIDNLALSDRILGRMMQDIRQSGAADRTTVLLSSDHSWRMSLWRHSYGWTEEDELASHHGQFDPRPMLMVHFPGETHGATFQQKFPLIDMHGMIEAMMAGRIENAAELDAWRAQQSSSGAR